MPEKPILSRKPRLSLAALAALLGLLLVAPARAQVEFLVIDEDSIDNGTGSIENIAFAPPWCGGGRPDVCVNDDIANPGVRAELFTRPSSILPFFGLVLPTGQTGDAGLFRFTRPDPQVSLQNGATFAMSEFFAASGAAANENNLDKIDGVVALDAGAIYALRGKTVCAVVFDSDVSLGSSPVYGSLKGATLGRTAFRVTSVSAHPAGGAYLPLMTVDLLPLTSCSEEPLDLPG